MGMCTFDGLPIMYVVSVWIATLYQFLEFLELLAHILKGTEVDASDKHGIYYFNGQQKIML